jgi:hypothetical protein
MTIAAIIVIGATGNVDSEVVKQLISSYSDRNVIRARFILKIKLKNLSSIVGEDVSKPK